MKFAAKSLLLLFALAATLAYAQTEFNTPIQHVIVVIQENRTPTNLFYADQTLINNGAHIVTQGTCKGSKPFNLVKNSFVPCFDPHHGHSAWTGMWDDGAMDGACGTKYDGTCQLPACPDGIHAHCPQMTYASNDSGILNPYFRIAEQSGFANFMFQTNQGPSFEAHQFLLSGTSAPIYYNDTHGYYKWFAAENPPTINGVKYGDNTGCTGSDPWITLIDENGNDGPPNGCINDPTDPRCQYPCYTHNDLPRTVLDANSISWKYYARDTLSLWTAPNADFGICVPQNGTLPGDICTGTDWTNYVLTALPTSQDAAPILTDIENCRLPQVSFVIPDGDWSDHPDSDPGDGGPSWVSWIVNAVGKSNCTNPAVNWYNTVILVTWDDWGGFYDDVVPFDCPPPGPNCNGYDGSNGKYYVYGFRVPLMVVSAYTNQVTPQGGYISNLNHDFGSILNFIEYVFGQKGVPLNQIGDKDYPYADHFAPELTQGDLFGLSDFFTANFGQSHAFTAIPYFYPEKCFHQPNQPHCFPNYPQDPDSDAIDDQSD